MKEKTKVISYIFRTNKDSIREVLVFLHRDFPEAGIQVVGGTVDAGEELVPALLRELAEESGLTALASDCHFLGETTYYRKDIPEKNLRHYYEVKIGGLPDSWSHTVQSDGADNNMVFNFYWLSTEEAKRVLEGNFGECL